MEIVKRRGPGEVLYGFYQLSHPIPVLFHIVVVTIFVLVAAWPRFSWGIIALVIAAHVAMQVSIAILNDYCDRRLDALSKKNKPIPLGLVRPREALIVGLLLIVLMVVLLLPLPPLALLVSCIYLALGQAYNLGLKSTPLSGIVFALAIPLIPLYAFLGVGHLLPVILWLVPVAALLGVCVNLANSLSDIDEDAANGARTLAVVLGARGVYLTCPLLIIFSIILIGVLTATHVVAAQTLLVLTTLIVTGLIALGLFVLFRPNTLIRAGKGYFYAIVITCILLALGWLTGVLI
jgi:4-hydroxybenzoate polyprenyltransferase